MGGALCPELLRSVHGLKPFLNLLLLAVLPKDGFMRSALSVVYSITLIGVEMYLFIVFPFMPYRKG